MKLLVLFFLFLFLNSKLVFGQKSISDEIVENIYDVNEKFTLDSSKQQLFLLITRKNCFNCFDQVGHHFDSLYPGIQIYGIVLMPKDLLALLPTQAIYKYKIHCVKDVFFYFTDNNNDTSNMSGETTPQAILRINDTSIYFPYREIYKILPE